VKAEFVNPFLEATIHVFNQLMQEPVVRGRTSIKKTPAPSHEIAIIFGVKGAVEGQIIYSMNAETAYKISEKLMPGTDRATLEKEYRDVLGEIGNMITGNALNVFYKTSKEIDLSVPYVMDVRTQAANVPDRQTLGLHLYTRVGMLELNIALG